jgi:hypothetical protein
MPFHGSIWDHYCGTATGCENAFFIKSPQQNQIPLYSAGKATFQQVAFVIIMSFTEALISKCRYW